MSAEQRVVVAVILLLVLVGLGAMVGVASENSGTETPTPKMAVKCPDGFVLIYDSKFQNPDRRACIPGVLPTYSPEETK